MKRKTEILNLFSGLGGNRKFWENCNVTSVEIDSKIANTYKLNFPHDEIIISNAYIYLINNYEKFDFIWASPPCQTHTKMIKSGRNRKPIYQDFRLYEIIFFLQNYYKGKWIVENIKPFYKPLIEPTKELNRHLIWSNFDIPDFEFKNIKNFINKGNSEGANEMKKWLGIDYPGNIYYKNNHDPAQVLRNCLHPKIGEHIYKSANFY